MNVIALGLANAPFGVSDMPLRDAFALGLLFAGISLLIVASYLLFAGAGPIGFPAETVRDD